MAREKEKSKGLRRLARGLGALAASLLVMGGIYLAAVLLQDPAEIKNAPAAQEQPPAVSRMQSAAMEDIPALAGMFEAPLPMVPGFSCRGEAGNTAYDGGTARIATLTYEGLIISAVQPAAAAPLLLRGDLETSLQSGLTVLGLPAMLASRDNQQCLYFSNETAAYSLYAPSAGQEDFLALAERLVWAE